MVTSYSPNPDFVIGGTAFGGNVAAQAMGLYAGTDVDGVANVMVMSDSVLTIADGLEFGVTNRSGVGPGVEEGLLIELGADSLAVDLLAPGPNLNTHSEPI